MHAESPVSTALVAWGNAWLAGHVGLDEAADQVEQAHGPVMVAARSLRAHLADLRLSGLSEFRLALPAPGDPLGLSGPPPFNAAAIDAGQAVIAVLPEGNQGLVPQPDLRGSSYRGVAFTVHPAGPVRVDLAGVAEAERELAGVMRTATQAFDGVDGPVAARPERLPAAELAPGYPARAHRVQALAGRLAVVLRLAEQRGLTAGQLATRDLALRELDRAVRRAQVAAHHAILEPQGL
ncbi:hypothetical protein [Nonomuraea sp. NPDC050310]|uniref:hypothetical protein n=1 Tax=unclassified Nonomuraea TaxID=2593643 RepID=UPI00340862A9